MVGTLALCPPYQATGEGEDEISARLPRRLGMDRQRMHGAFEFRRERRVNHAVALDPGLPFEGRRYNIHPEVRLAAGSVARVTFMQM